MGSIFSWHRSALLHSVQKDCGTRAPTEKIFKLMNQVFRSTQGTLCGSTGAMLVPALQIYYYNIIMVTIIKPPTIGLFIYCTTTGITPTTAGLFCWHKTVFHTPARSGMLRCNHWKRIYGKLWGTIWILSESSCFSCAPNFLLLLHIMAVCQEEWTKALYVRFQIKFFFI